MHTLLTNSARRHAPPSNKLARIVSRVLHDKKLSWKESSRARFQSMVRSPATMTNFLRLDMRIHPVLEIGGKSVATMASRVRLLWAFCLRAIPERTDGELCPHRSIL